MAEKHLAFASLLAWWVQAHKTVYSQTQDLVCGFQFPLSGIVVGAVGALEQIRAAAEAEAQLATPGPQGSARQAPDDFLRPYKCGVQSRLR